jgi:hypothetical protein
MSDAAGTIARQHLNFSHRQPRFKRQVYESSLRGFGDNLLKAGRRRGSKSVSQTG